MENATEKRNSAPGWSRAGRRGRAAVVLGEVGRSRGVESWSRGRFGESRQRAVRWCCRCQGLCEKAVAAWVISAERCRGREVLCKIRAQRSHLGTLSLRKRFGRDWREVVPRKARETNQGICTPRGARSSRFIHSATFSSLSSVYHKQRYLEEGFTSLAGPDLTSMVVNVNYFVLYSSSSESIQRA